MERGRASTFAFANDNEDRESNRIVIEVVFLSLCRSQSITRCLSQSRRWRDALIKDAALKRTRNYRTAGNGRQLKMLRSIKRSSNNVSSFRWALNSSLNSSRAAPFGNFAEAELAKYRTYASLSQYEQVNLQGVSIGRTRVVIGSKHRTST